MSRPYCVSVVPPARFERATPGLGSIPFGALIDPDLAPWFAPWLRLGTVLRLGHSDDRSISVADEDADDGDDRA